ncbi:DUF58 domain-containing protein [Novosphingobium flavum]|uniref:DUF58 domain-containing protein n=1 Tax=Novosphingobium flavum TaxID=1778672 RepID=UPI001FE68ECB|nr:DUF58 domain-containing protein [Novosphingobium flavum]
MAPKAPIVPTTRAALLAALAAPLALVLAALAPAAWIIAPLLGLALLALVLLDALLAGRLIDARLIAPDDAEVGEPLQIAVLADLPTGRPAALEAALALDPRLAAGGTARFPLRSHLDTWQGAAQLTPHRRGPAPIAGLTLRWTGPLGLGARQRTFVQDRTVRIWPSLALVRSTDLQLFLRESESGLIARRMRGEGSQFEALSEYQPGMDRRRIDWKASARHTHLYAREYEAERNNPIVFALDCGRAMCEPVAGLPRIDRAVSAALAAAWVALKGGDRAALFGFAARPEVATPFVTGTAAFARLQRAAAMLDYSPAEPNFTLALATLAGRLQRRSLIVVFSEFPDPTSAELLLDAVARLARRHVVLFVTMADEELAGLADKAPADMARLAEAVAADGLLRQRQLVIARLHALGVEVVEAPHGEIGMRLIDAYLAIKRKGTIG